MAMIAFQNVLLMDLKSDSSQFGTRMTTNKLRAVNENMLGLVFDEIN